MAKRNHFFLVFSLILCTFAHSFPTDDSIDAFLQESALETLVRRSRLYTGALYEANLPANLSGMEASVVRLRSRRLWDEGANFSHFGIPSNTLPVPRARRIAIVYHDLGNWSSLYFNIPGYFLETSVVGFMVFDASNTSATNTTKLSVDTMGNPITIHFPDLKRPSGESSIARCAEFDEDGAFRLSQMGLPGVCFARKQGYFAVVSELKKKTIWSLCVVGSVLGIGGLVVAGYAAIVSVRALKTKKIQVMEKQADEDLVLQSRWVGSSKMPLAGVTRTLPVLENAGFP